MINSKLKLIIITIFTILIVPVFMFSQDGRKPWNEVAAPAIVSVDPAAGSPGRINVSFTLLMGSDGADKAIVEMMNDKGNILDKKQIGKSSKEIKTADFTVSKSGSYSFKVTANRNNVTEAKISEIKKYDYSFPLLAPIVSVSNSGNGKLSVKWEPINEAESYIVSFYKEKDEKNAVVLNVNGTNTEISELVAGQKYNIVVTAVRGENKVSSSVYGKTVKAEKDREWKFAWFGQSTKGDVNTIEMIDADNFKFKLNSCTFTADGKADQKGGKFTAFHDGISYYYTVIDPDKENFELTATFKVDYINPVADGQEGFGLLAMDSIGENGNFSKNHYTNSAGIISLKYEAFFDGIKKSCKDVLGSRFVYGITPEVLASGDSGISKNSTSTLRAYSYEQEDLIKTGKSYILSLKKTNTGYHAILKSKLENVTNRVESEVVKEYIMYGPEKLLQLDKDHVYVGFVVARGCNVTVSDVSMKITDPKTDPPAQKEPQEIVPLVTKVDSPEGYGLPKYPFVFTSNADGKLNVTKKDGTVLIKDQDVIAFKDFKKEFSLIKGNNDYIVKFTPDPNFKPGLKKVLDTYAEVKIIHSVSYFSFDRKELYVSQFGMMPPGGNGTKAKPLDITTALQFIQPGQSIILTEGTYFVSKFKIARGNDGTEKLRKYLKAAPGERVIIDFSSASSGMEIWGNYWTIEDIEVCNTIGNIKGIQVSGNNNILKNVKTYSCGDTGLQVSGISTEKYDKWPKNNLILNCTSYNNCDPAENNADGFAAKLSCGEGNIFRGCISYSNIDDGWDLFSKIESGPIGAVLIENCVAYKNGSLLNGSGNGDGNGFKLGGDGIAVPHVLKNSIAFNNGAAGVTSNSDPAVIIENCTTFGNKGFNLSLYGKGTGDRLFKVKNTISMKGGSGDLYKEMPGLLSLDNYFWNGAKTLNSEGTELKADIFVNTDMNIIPGRKSDGSIDMKGLFKLTEKAPKGIGADLK